MIRLHSHEDESPGYSASASQRHFSEDSHWVGTGTVPSAGADVPDGVWCRRVLHGIQPTGMNARTRSPEPDSPRAVSSTSSSTASHPHLPDRTHPEDQNMLTTQVTAGAVLPYPPASLCAGGFSLSSIIRTALRQNGMACGSPPFTIESARTWTCLAIGRLPLSRWSAT